MKVNIEMMFIKQSDNYKNIIYDAVSDLNVKSVYNNIYRGQHIIKDIINQAVSSTSSVLKYRFSLTENDELQTRIFVANHQTPVIYNNISAEIDIKDDMIQNIETEIEQID